MEPSPKLSMVTPTSKARRESRVFRWAGSSSFRKVSGIFSSRLVGASPSSARSPSRAVRRAAQSCHCAQERLTPTGAKGPGLLLPLTELLADPTKDPPIEPVTRLGPWCSLPESRGPEDPPPGVMPPEKGLEAVQSLVQKPYFGLVIEEELFPVQGSQYLLSSRFPPSRALHGWPRRTCARQRPLAKLVSPVALGGVHGLTRRVDQLFRGPIGSRGRGAFEQPDAEGKLYGWPAFQTERFLEGGQEMLGHRLAEAVLVPFQQDHELIAPDSSHRIRPPNGPG